MNKWIKYGLWILVFMLMSCQDFLEPKSQSEYVPGLVQSLDELLLGEVYMGPGDGALISFLGMLDDDVAIRSNIGDYDERNESVVKQLQLAFTWSGDMINALEGYNLYETVYKRIVGCNSALDYVDCVQGSDNQKNFVKAQALALRSYYYFHLVNMYGKPYSVDRNALGVPLKLTSNLSTGGMSRNTVGEVYDQVVKDLLEAERLFKILPKGEWVKRDNRVGLPMIQLLLSRVYLYMENWSEAVVYGEKVIRDYSYTILDLNTIEEPNPYSPSPYQDYFTWENPETIFLFGDKYDRIRFQLSVVILYNEWGNSVMQNIGVVSEDLINAYEPADLRKSRYLIWESTNGGSVQPIYRLPVSKIDVGSYYTVNYTSGTNWAIAFKITEAYLNVAEASAMLFKEKGERTYLTKAWNLVDQLRMKRFPVGAFQACSIDNPEKLVSFVRDERRREFCFENHRWFDLRRYGMEELRHIWYDKTGLSTEYVLRKNDPGFTLLIPREAFSLNPDLEQNEQRGK